MQVATKYLTKSVDILNEADRFENIMKFQEFANAQEMLLWAGEPGWRPGDPLFAQEYNVDYAGAERGVMPKARCKPCQTYWNNDEPCFSCGEKREHCNPFDEFNDWLLDMNSVSYSDSVSHLYSDGVVSPERVYDVISYSAMDVELTQRYHELTMQLDHELWSEMARLNESLPPGVAITWESRRVFSRPNDQLPHNWRELAQQSTIEEPVLDRTNPRLEAYLARNRSMFENDLLNQRRTY